MAGNDRNSPAVCTAPAYSELVPLCSVHLIQANIDLSGRATKAVERVSQGHGRGVHSDIVAELRREYVASLAAQEATHAAELERMKADTEAVHRVELFKVQGGSMVACRG